jgi:Mce-associated membrane protein
MPIRQERALRQIKDGMPDTTGRNVRRWVFTSHIPRPVEPVEDPLTELGRESVEVEKPVQSEESRPAGTESTVEERDAGDLPTSRRVLIGLLLAALVAAGVFGSRLYTDRSLDAAHQAALAAAKQTTVNFVSVSASSVDRDLQRISAGATGEFKDQFTRGEPQVRAAIVENKVESRGSVLRAGLVSGDSRSAVVLVAIDATVKNVKAPDGRVSHYRIQVDMARDSSGAWLVSRLQFVG